MRINRIIVQRLEFALKRKRSFCKFLETSTHLERGSVWEGVCASNGMPSRIKIPFCEGRR